MQCLKGGDSRKVSPSPVNQNTTTARAASPESLPNKAADRSAGAGISLHLHHHAAVMGQSGSPVVRYAQNQVDGVALFGIGGDGERESLIPIVHPCISIVKTWTFIVHLFPFTHSQLRTLQNAPCFFVPQNILLYIFFIQRNITTFAQNSSKKCIVYTQNRRI